MTLEEKLSRYFGKRLRQLFYRSPIRAAVFALYATPQGYKCHYCGKFFTNRADLELEHKQPAVPVDQTYVSSGERFIRMFGFDILEGKLVLGLDNFVLSCVTCHRVKSKEEMGLRAKHKTGPYSEAAKERRKVKRARKTKKRPKRYRKSSR